MRSSIGRRFRLATVIITIVAVTFSVVVLPVTIASAATDTVTTCASSGSGSLPAIVAAAASGDTVTFSVACPASAPIALTVPVDITENLTIDGTGASAVVVSGSGVTRVFEIGATATVTISGVTVEDGTAPPGGNGGGIDNAGTLTLTGDIVSGNSTLPGLDGTSGLAGKLAVNGGSGGGIENSGTLTVTDSTVADNTTGGGGNGGSDIKNRPVRDDKGGDGANGGNGGGIENSGTLTVSDSTVSGNTTGTGGNGGDDNLKYDGNGGGGGLGGGISSTGGVGSGPGTVTLTDDTISDNITGPGGAAGVEPGKPRVKAGDGGSGGGLYINPLGHGIVSDTTFSGNRATGDVSYGGGILDEEEKELMLSNSTLAGNSAWDGGAISTGPDGEVTMYNSTVVGNSAYGRAPIIGAGIASASIGFYVAASIVAQNSPGTNCVGNFVDDGYNIDDDGTCGLTAATSLSDTPAGLDPSGLANNGGPTETVALVTGSPAVAAMPSSGLCADPDQRGVARPIPCDIGAVQVAVAPLTSQTISFSSASPTNATVGGPKYGVTASATSGLPVTLAIDSWASTVCQIAGSTVSFVGVGTCSVDASQSGNATYFPAPVVRQIFDVGPTPRAIVSPDSATATVGTAFLFTVSTTGSPVPSITMTGTLPKHLTLVNNDNGAATISGNPTKKGTYQLTIKATFGTGKTKDVVTQAFTLTISPG